MSEFEKSQNRLYNQNVLTTQHGINRKLRNISEDIDKQITVLEEIAKAAKTQAESAEFEANLAKEEAKSAKHEAAFSKIIAIISLVVSIASIVVPMLM